MNTILVGVGGFVGSVLRFYVGGLVLQFFAASKFPIATLLVNLVGCLLIGILAGCAQHFHAFSPQVRLLVFTGILGGFTTFSAFGFETYYLIREENLSFAFLNVFLSCCCGIALVWLGDRFVHLW